MIEIYAHSAIARLRVTSPMTFIRYAGLSAVFVASLGYGAQAQEPTPTTVYAALHASIPLDQGSFATVFLRSVPLDLLAEHGTEADNFYNSIADITNGAVAPNWISQLEPGTAAELYTHLVSEASWGRVPFTTEMKEYEELTAALYVKSGNGQFLARPAVKRLLELQANLAAVTQEWVAAKPEERTPALKARLDAAKAALQNDTEANKLIPKLARLKTLVNYDYRTRGLEAKERLNRNIDAKTGKLATKATPQISFFSQASSWEAVSVTLDVSTPAPPGSLTPTLPPVWCCDLPAAGAGNELSPVFKMEFERMVVKISQPWRDDQILSGAARQIWKWKGDEAPLSRGQAGLADPGGGVDLTLLPRQLVLIRNVKISGEFEESLMRAIAEAATGKRRVYFGPIAVAGDFAFGNGLMRIQPFGVDRKVIAVSAVQIIGLTGDILPPAPDPRADLVWEDPLPTFEGLGN
ncbi:MULTISPECIES: hypothetical protein [unclassified Mesorhizobium]|uniref:hypothetical protein n=1 Tax=unclassified Mesorhizobium TaxID=325217 RepID=UPI00333DDD7A